VLEDRLAPATLTVNSTLDTANPTDLYLSLREAIALFNSATLPTGLSTQILGQISGILHDGSTDTILFDHTTVNGPITLGGTQLRLSLPLATATITIDGGTGVTIDGGNQSRIFQVDSGVQAALNHLTLTHGNATGTLADGAGGAIYNQGALSLSNSTLTSNTVNTNGGAIYNLSAASLAVANCTLSSNSAPFSTSSLGGGAIYNTLGMVTVTNSLLTGNSAIQGGGVFNNGGTLTVLGSTIRGNDAFTGGGIKNMPPQGTARATLIVISSTLSGNTASNGGGGISNVSSRASATVTNSSFAANYCQFSRGGAILNNLGQLAINFSTLSTNTAGTEGGGLYNDSTLSLQSTILSGNHSEISVGTDVYSFETVATGSYNVIGIGNSLRGISNGDSNHNQVGDGVTPLQPRLAASGSYGGTTETFALLPGSPALGRGDPGTTLTTDQRGLPRSRGGLVDVGAYQSQGFTLAPLPSASVATTVNTAFTVGVRVTANDTGLTNLTGGLLTLAVTPAANGASAILGSGSTVTLGTGSDYPLDATANTTAGSYTLTAQSGTGSLTFNLTNNPDVPASVAVVGGDSQNTRINTPFSNPLQVFVTDQFNNPVPGASVTFAGPMSGAGATFSSGGMVTTDPTGQASVTATANGRAGHYTVTASAGLATPANFTLGNSELPSLVVTNLADESDPFHGVSLRDAITYAESLPPGPYTITFDPTILPDPINNVILLENPLPVLSGNLTLQGPATNNLTIQRDVTMTPFSVFTAASGASANFSHLTISGGASTFGGGIQANGATVTVSGCTLSGNSAFDSGGGIYQSGGTLTVSGSSLQANSASFVGGGLYASSGSATVGNCTLSGNFALLGGGLYADSGSTLLVSNSTLSGNSASISGQGGGGAGIYASTGSTLTLSYSTLAGNLVTNPGGVGGAIHADPSSFVTVSNSTLSGNFAAAGGGIYTVSGWLAVNNSTLYGNSARFDGGGIEVTSGTLTLSNSTLAGNTANNGGGINVYLASATVTSTIIAGNSANTAPDAASNVLITSQGNNLIGIVDASFGWQTDTDLLGTTSNPLDPRLSAPGYYGGPTQTLILLAGSPALGHGAAPTSLATALDNQTTSVTVANASLLGVVPNSTVLMLDSEQVLVTALAGNTLTVQRGVNGTSAASHDVNTAVYPAGDQRGQPRTRGGVTDIGAFQVQANPFVVTTRQDPGLMPGQLSLREAVNLANALPGANTISFSGTLDSGTVSLTAGQLELSGTGGVQTIDGGYHFTITGNNNSRLFQIDAGTQAVLRGFILTGGRAGNGGAVLNQGTLTLADSTLRGNSADNGGAIYNTGTLTLRGSTLGFGTASLGAGVYNAGVLIAFNSTFASNTAGTAGGAVYNAASGTATMTSLTISSNSAATGGGIDVVDGAVLVDNCIVAGNFAADGTTPSDVAGTVSASSSYDLIGTGGSGGLSDGVNHNLVGVADPGLIAPDFLSNQTPVFSFQTGSPALGAGDPTLLSDPDLRLDQHGNPRSNPPDIGAM
jgi:hypothetical protein